MSDLNIVLLYIDPGVGFLALQMLAGVVLGAGFYFRRSLRTVLRLVRTPFRLKRPPEPDPKD